MNYFTKMLVAGVVVCGMCGAEESRRVVLDVPVFRNATMQGPRAGEGLGGVLGFFVKLKGRDTLLHAPVAADTFVMRNKDADKGGEGLVLLRTNGEWCALLKADLCTLDGINASDVEEVTLSLNAPWVEKPGNDARFSVFAMTTDWAESATWNAPRKDAAWKGKGPDFEKTPLATREYPAFKPGAVEVPGLAEAMRGWLSGTRPNYGVMIQLQGGITQANVIARERGGDAPVSATVTLREGEAAIFAPDGLTLETLLIAQDDVLAAELRVRLAGANTLPKETLIEIFALRTETKHLKNRQPQAGRDYDERAVGSVKISALNADKVLLIPVAANALRATHGFVVRVTNAGKGEVVFGSDSAKGINTPQFIAHLRVYPNEQLFTNPVTPKSGVYTRVKDGHFDYGGQRLRLWGVAMTPRPNPEIADRLHKLGFNAVRLWGPDAGTFYDANSTTGLPRDNTKDDNSKADQYHRLFAAMKAKGLFIDFTSLMDSTPVSTADDSWLKTEGADDWEAWRAAWNTKDLNRVIRTFGASFDERLMAARKRHIRNILTFRNPYTGKTYGEEECIALFELNNEQSHIMRMLEKGFDDWPDYFRKKYQTQWNNWLRKKYPAERDLVAAWGKLPPGETYGAVALDPILTRRDKFPAARAADFIQFNCEAVIALYKELETFARSQGPAARVVPFSYDTQFRPGLQWLHTIAAGDVANFGMYFWTLTSALSGPPAMYNMDSLTVSGKPTVIYETNVGRPNPYRTEAPFRIAAFASHQNWDAVFWHFFSGITSSPDVPDEQYLAAPLKYMTPNFYWTAVEFETDPLLQSAISLAGRIFVDQLLPPAKNPVLYTIPRDSLYAYENFNGINTARAAFEHGAAFVFRPDLPGHTIITGADPELLKQRLTTAVASGEHILWDWPNSRLLIDAPGVKAYIGKPAGYYQFKDGITVNTTSGDFISLALASSDTAPLLTTKSPAYFTALDNAQNTGFGMDTHDILRPNGMHTAPDLQAKHITAIGRAPILYTPVNVQLLWPKTWTGNATTYDFAFRKTSAQKLPASNTYQRNAPQDLTLPWLTLLNITSSGALHPQPATTLQSALQSAAPGATQRPAATTHAAANQTYNPLPGLSWSDPYFAAHQILRDGALLITSISPEDNSAKPDKTLTLFNAELLPNSAADIDVVFANNAMSRITLTFTRPLLLADLLNHLEKSLGLPAQRTLVETADKTTTIDWSKKAGLSVQLKEAQGVQTVTFKYTAE